MVFRRYAAEKIKSTTYPAYTEPTNMPTIGGIVLFSAALLVVGIVRIVFTRRVREQKKASVDLERALTDYLKGMR